MNEDAAGQPVKVGYPVQVTDYDGSRSAGIVVEVEAPDDPQSDCRLFVMSAQGQGNRYFPFAANPGDPGWSHIA